MARLADTYAADGQVAEACAAGSDAVGVLLSAPSARARAALRSTRNHLFAHRRSPQVRELTEQMAAVG
ncbi:MAG: hypothetical protein ACRCYU_18830 [Nocardioides sp.]